MGLDTSHNAWHGPYGAFNRFRFALAEQIGIDLAEYDGYSKGGTKELSTIDHDLMPLLNHSDCDGELTPAECTQIANGLNQVIANIHKKDSPEEGFTWFVDHIIQFRDGCLLAASKNESIEFH